MEKYESSTNREIKVSPMIGDIGGMRLMDEDTLVVGINDDDIDASGEKGYEPANPK